MELRQLALQALQQPDPQAKTMMAQALWTQAQQLGMALQISDHQEPEPAGLPGRPALPRLIPHGQLARRSPFTPQGHAALMHSIAHIEFNAINLALDAIWRFAGMPRDYYLDWLLVASEEAKHFALLQAHLQSLGHQYGDFDAHDGLWLMCEHTRHDPVARMALVPRTLEARGLDATPVIQAKLRRVGTAVASQACAILDIILRDEVGHVAIGNHWYRWLCQQQQLEPLSHYRVLARRHQAPRPKPPLNLAARRAAGFSAEELAELDQP